MKDGNLRVPSCKFYILTFLVPGDCVVLVNIFDNLGFETRLLAFSVLIFVCLL